MDLTLNTAINANTFEMVHFVLNNVHYRSTTIMDNVNFAMRIASEVASVQRII